MPCLYKLYRHVKIANSERYVIFGFSLQMDSAIRYAKNSIQRSKDRIIKLAADKETILEKGEVKHTVTNSQGVKVTRPKHRQIHERRQFINVSLI